MPKVETSPNLGGEFFKTQNVSNIIGNINSNEIRSKINLRHKRDVIKDADVILPYSQNKRRVVKKLVRVQPVINQTLLEVSNNLESSTEADRLDVTTRRARRRLKIKKKKRRLHYNDYSQNIDNEEHLQQATKPRRKVVITRKRILPNSAKTVAESTTATLTQNVEITTATLRETTAENFVDSAYNEFTAENSTENLIDNDKVLEDTGEDDYDDDENEDSTENQIDDERTTDDYNEYNNSDYSEDEDQGEELGQPTFQNIPEYEPSFPEITESLEAPLLLLKTTILSSVETLTKTITQSRLRTYTFVVTRVSGNEQIITSTTEVKEQIKTSTVFEPVTSYTTLTLLDFDATETLTEPQDTQTGTVDGSPLLNEGEFSIV